MYGLTRGVMTALGAGVAGFLIWIASALADGNTTGAYWGRTGLIAAAGLVMALSQLLGGWTKWGRPRLSGNVFAWGFLPTLVCAGWVLVANEPGSGWFTRHVSSWSGDIGVGSVVNDLGVYAGVLAFGIGLVFGFTLDTTGSRRIAERRLVEERAEDEPLTAERIANEHRPVGGGAVRRTDGVAEPIAASHRSLRGRRTAAPSPPPAVEEPQPEREPMHR